MRPGACDVRRRLVIIAAFLLAGAVVNVAVMFEWLYLPLWPGFVANILFYPVVLWLVMYHCCGASSCASIRRRPSQCVNCGYPIGESPVCTECGRELAT